MDLGLKIEQPKKTPFIKLKDGDSIVGVFRGNPVKFKSEWTGDKTRRYPIDHPMGGFRFQLNLVEKDSWEAKVLEGGAMIYNQLIDLQSEGYSLQDTWVRIRRTGEGMNTTYSVVPIKESALNEEHQAKIGAVSLNELKIKYDAVESLPTPDFNETKAIMAQSITESDIPF